MKTLSGFILVIAALGMWLSGLGDTVKDLQDWHGLATPAIAGILVKQLGTILVSTAGGILIPLPSVKNDDKISDKKRSDL